VSTQRPFQLIALTSSSYQMLQNAAPSNTPAIDSRPGQEASKNPRPYETCATVSRSKS
jgi:hypothetical protein